MLTRRAHGRLRLARTRATKVGRLARQPRQWRVVRAGVWPSVEHAAVPFAAGTASIVDVGASRGQFATFAAHRFPRAELVCFEPLPEARALLESVVGDRAAIHAVAVGAEAGTATLNISSQDDSSSLLPIGDGQVSRFPGTGHAATLDVEVVTLADVDVAALPAPRLLKIDVQGLELAVLQGAGASLDLFDEVFVECSFVELYEGQALADEVIAHLLGRGLRLRGLFGMIYDETGASVQADLLFTRG